MFDRNDRYDLSEVGRYKMNQRLNLDRKKTNKLLDPEDLVGIVNEIIADLGAYHLLLTPSIPSFGGFVMSSARAAAVLVIATTLFGVTFDVTTGAQPTVALYMNDAPVGALFLFQSLFDIGQIEVLKGPQGTTRGVSAPMCSIAPLSGKTNSQNTHSIRLKRKACAAISSPTAPGQQRANSASGP